MLLRPQRLHSNLKMFRAVTPQAKFLARRKMKMNNSQRHLESLTNYLVKSLKENGEQESKKWKKKCSRVTKSQDKCKLILITFFNTVKLFTKNLTRNLRH
jgi:sugar-specific transcriptional regulator TrmB